MVTHVPRHAADPKHANAHQALLAGGSIDAIARRRAANVAAADEQRLEAEEGGGGCAHLPSLCLKCEGQAEPDGKDRGRARHVAMR